MLLPVDVVIEAIATLLAFVGDRNTSLLAERHRPIAIAALAIGADADRNRGEGFVHAEADAEEIADGTFHTRMLLAVPINPQSELGRIEGIAVGDGEPDVHYLARPVEFSQRE